MTRERHTHSRPPALLPRPGFSAHPGSSGRRAWRALSLPLPSQIPRGHVGPERAAHDSRASETPPQPTAPPSPVHVSIPHSQPGGARGSLMRLEPRQTSRFRSPLFYVLFFLPIVGSRWGPSGAGRLRWLHFPRGRRHRSHRCPFSKALLARRRRCFTAALPEARVGGTLLPPPESVRGSRGHCVGIDRAAAPSPSAARELAGSAPFGMDPGRSWGKTRPLLGVGGGEEGTCLPTGCFASL